ncbi:hypothetical protein PGT21_028390 [Puccinia graminis f. sp. tritici]|uniref:Uncharacterized protein n=1 Tax=Puccinia graminis f. sp. tritici TaxID=56615 RepID=A0A5B0QJJ0_PUCGR|nr:hypothetical protein PGT21_026825 [Puccinia graminis f. sp. tritici]KAA1113336.1 hypothetical protein PGT21_028390 [Puccinia graminis f. sp. tritici]
MSDIHKHSSTPEFDVSPIPEAIVVATEVIQGEPRSEVVPPPADEQREVLPNMPVRRSRRIFNQTHEDGSFTMASYSPLKKKGDKAGSSSRGNHE